MIPNSELESQITDQPVGGNLFSPLLRLGILGLLLAGLAAAFCFWQQEQAAASLASHDLPPALASGLGINVELQQYDSASLDSTLERIENAGLGWVRQTFPWAEIEARPGRFEWTPWDAIVEGVAEHNLRLIAVLDSTPDWAQPDPAHPHPGAPPQETADFGRFARAFAQRYGGAIDHYQIWDEPNLSARWGGEYVDAAAYVRLLREGYIQIQETDPSASVIMAGLAPTVENGPLNLNEAAFLESIYAAGGADFFDIAAAKPYGFWHRAGDPQTDVNILNLGRVQLLRQVMKAHGDSAKPLWAVAFGWNSLPADWSGRPSPWGTDTEAVQAADTVAAIERARREWPWLQLFFLPPLRPDVPPDDPFIGFSLLDETGNPRPVYDAVRALASEAPLAWPGNYRPDHPSARYTGEWRVTSAAADIPHGADGDPGASLRISFYGTRLDLAVRRGDFWGLLYLSIDGQPANRLPRDSQGRAYLVLHDPLCETDTVTLASGLTDGPHEAVITPAGGWGQWAIVGWAVTRDPDSTPWRAAFMFSLAASALGLGLIIFYLCRKSCVTVQGVFKKPENWAGIGRLRDENKRKNLLIPSSWQRILRFDVPTERLQSCQFVPRTFNKTGLLPLMALAAFAFYLAPGLPLSLISLAALALLVFLRPDYGLALVAFSIPFFLRSKVLAGRAFSPVEIGTLLCFAAWIARVIRRPQFTIRGLSSTDWAVAGLVGLGALSLTWADNFGVAARDFRVVVLEAGLFYLLLRAQAQERGSDLYHRVVAALAAGAVLASGIALWQYFVSGDLITAEGVRRVRAFYGSPNNLALFLERILPLLAALALWAESRRRRIFYALALLPVFAAFFLTFSRGALFVGLPAGLLFLLLLRGRRALWPALAALLIIALALIPFVSAERFAGTFDLSQGTAFFRLKLWQSTINMLAEHPLTGVGLDNFLYAYRTRYVLPEASAELDLSHPHNIVLDFWTRLGLGGVLLLLWLLVAFFRQGIGRYCRLPEGNDRALLLGLLAAMVAALAHGLIDHSFFLVDLAFVFVLILAAAQPSKSPGEIHA